MVMSWIYTGLVFLSVLFAFLGGTAPQVSAAVLEGAQSGITLTVSIAGAICLWSGVGKLMEASGITDGLSRVLMPVLGRLFPSGRRDTELRRCLCANVCANLLGLGNAATPMGIRAARRMVRPEAPGEATDEMCRLIVMNTASIQLLPTNVAALRSSLGSSHPFDILPAVWLTSLLSVTAGLTAAWVFGRVLRHD